MEIHLLSGLADDERERVLASTTHRRYRPNEILFHEGDLGESLHLIGRGHIAVRIATRLGENVTLHVLGPGDFLGELALLDADHRRTATAVALEPVETVTLQRGEFTQLCRTHPGVHRVLEEALAEDVRRVSVRLAEAYHLPADKRVYRRLLELAATWADGDEPPVVPMSQETIASLAGTSRPTANRVLRAAEANGWVELRRGKILVLGADEMAAAAR